MILLALLAIALLSCAISELLEPIALHEMTQQLVTKDKGISSKNLVLYHVGHVVHEDSLEVSVNNVKMFSSAVMADKQDSNHRTLYIFSVSGGAANPLAKYLPTANHSISVKSPLELHDLQSHMHIVTLLGESILLQFKHVLMLSSEARGPFENRLTGLWWKPFSDLLQEHPSVGLVGPMMTCEGVPAIQTYMFAMPSNLVHKVFTVVQTNTKKKHKRAIETAISVETQSLGRDISSLLFHRRYNATIYKQDCIRNADIAAATTTAWCDLAPREVVFVRFGTNILHNRGHYCQEGVDRVVTATENVGLAEPQLHLSMQETMHGGKLYALYKEYTQEVWRGRFASRFVGNKSNLTPRPSSSGVAATTTGAVAPSSGAAGDKVCILVRTAIMHGSQGKPKEPSRTVPMDLPIFIQTLLRQNSSAWEAYFVVTDDQPFETELQAILAQYEDPRLIYLPLDAKFRQKYNPIDAGYPASDEAMRQVMNLPQCAYLSVTNGDNAYGSGVISTVLSAAAREQPKPQLIMMPMDSRNFDNLAYKNLREARGGYKGWSDHCTDFEARFSKHLYGFAKTPEAEVGSVDTAAVFIERDKFKQTGEFINDYNSKKKWNCKGCQDGLWVHTMVKKKNWTVYAPPLVSFDSLVFHGPSPLWCVAAGHVWYDRPDEHYACLPHSTVTAIAHDKTFDWEHYHMHKGLKICLRLSEAGYRAKNNATTFFH